MTITQAAIALIVAMWACSMFILWRIRRMLDRRKEILAPILSHHAGNLGLRISQAETRIITRLDGDLSEIAGNLSGFSDAVMALLVHRPDRQEPSVPDAVPPVT